MESASASQRSKMSSIDMRPLQRPSSFPMPHYRLGKSPCAFVVVKKGMTMATMREEMEAHCQKGIACGATVPLRVVFVVELPRTPSRTVRKAMLRELARRLKKAEEESSSGAPAAASAEVAAVAGRRRVKIGGKEEGIWAMPRL
ncbi:putative acyl-activating enzyme 5, peroxisomal [Apostasia shenzhenica]|uniref:Putative acyl-activating enzyme 5, peroxisomal n=1 Tax=Apostasia shenzhenica TaxID=1088818 RepID=A0A2I0AYJ7_9ASPA|nr:putative acyl-activating enzyme 5, peroxisomal [Apostasia shenzhenica]